MERGRVDPVVGEGAVELGSATGLEDTGQVQAEERDGFLRIGGWIGRLDFAHFMGERSVWFHGSEVGEVLGDWIMYLGA